MKTIAIIGPTASGKSDLALRIAQHRGAVILSLDSLSLYREIDIASAKPSPKELETVPHYGVDVLNPDQPFNVKTFIALYHEAREAAEAAEASLIIVGGTSFYLKVLIDGMSEIPEISQAVQERSETMLRDQAGAHALLSHVDPKTMQKIDPNDRYRTEKMLHLYLQTDTPPSAWFAAHPPRPILTSCDLYEIDMPREMVRQRIALRTKKMIKAGLVDEIRGLDARYGRSPQAMKAIGVVEVLQYLDGEITLEAMQELITTHTGQLAKRQQTFNRGQFADKVSTDAESIFQMINGRDLP